MHDSEPLIQSLPPRKSNRDCLHCPLHACAEYRSLLDTLAAVDLHRDDLFCLLPTRRNEYKWVNDLTTSASTVNLSSSSDHCVIAASERHSPAPKRADHSTTRRRVVVVHGSRSDSRFGAGTRLPDRQSHLSPSTQWVDAHCPQARFAACATRPHNRNQPPSHKLSQPSH